MVTLLWRESSHIRRSRRKSELSAGTDFNQNSRPYIVLKLVRDPHAMLVFYWSRLTPRNACFLLVSAYTHAMLVFQWLWFTHTQYLFTIVHTNAFLVSSNHFPDFMHLIFLNRFWFVHIPFVCMIKSQSLIQFPVTRHSHPVVLHLVPIFMTVSSSSSCRAASTDIPDPLLPLLPIVHRLWQIFRATSRILT